MIEKILIANRGEIAVRINRACREMGIRTVAVYSEADRDALHTQLADEAVCIGPAPSTDSYLNMEQILSACIATKADAIHPGFGFLSENSRFVEMCEKCNITFIGPTAEMMDKMGNKSQARLTMIEAGVPVVPGTKEPVYDAKRGAAMAEDIGYPVMIKASSGGGGKGMRIAFGPDDFEENFQVAQLESVRGFGDNTMYIEKYVQEPRHIEFQIMADKFGNVVQFGERDCSIQRNHQKMIEESPSVALTPELRRRMGDAAVRAAKAVHYESAGTIEFLLDKDKNFYFMERPRAVITGVGAYYPDYILTNEELSRMVDTTDEWIMTRIGIKERRILRDAGKGSAYLGARAVEDLFRKTGLKPEEVDLLICCTVTADMHFPANGNVISDMVGIKNAFSFDLNAGCSGFLYGLITATQYVESGRYKKVIVVGAEKMSAITDYTDRATCPIFGDAAAAVLLEPTTEDLGVIDHILRSDGMGRVHLHMKAGGSLKPPTIDTVLAREHYIYQEGQPVFKHAVSNMADVSVEVMERNNLSSEDVAWLVPHQANLRIIKATGERMGLPKEKVMVNIQKYGNTTSATIPLCLYEWEDQLKKGDNLILAAFGAGFTWGAIYLKWGYTHKG